MPVSEEGDGALFLQVNRNKRSITLDVDQPRGQEVMRRLLQTTDVVVANMPPRTLASLGLVLGLWQVSQGQLSRADFLVQYGHRGAHEFELSAPRPVEEPAWLDCSY